jgi:hypothetical protein
LQVDSGIAKGNFFEPILIAERERTQQDSIYNTEDGGIGADAQCQREHNNGSENGRFAKNAQRKLYVLKNGRHHPALRARKSFAAFRIERLDAAVKGIAAGLILQSSQRSHAAAGTPNKDADRN